MAIVHTIFVIDVLRFREGFSLFFLVTRLELPPRIGLVA